MSRFSAVWRPLALLLLGAIFLFLIFGISPVANILSPLSSSQRQPKEKEVFGFTPYWTINKLDNVDFNTLTTLAYFGIPIKPNGDLNKEHLGYTTFHSEAASELFKKAHSQKTKVVLTITQMDNSGIIQILDSGASQQKAIAQTVREVQNRGIDGVNVDFEYVGDPGESYRNKFNEFVRELSRELRAENPNSYLTVSVYAGSLLEPKLYDIKTLSETTDGIFMMAYDYAAYRATNVIPTSPLFGYKEGKYWYDVSTAVEDFLKIMSPEKLILGLPWYGYNYPVYEPGVQTATHKGYTYYTKVKYKKRGKTYMTRKKNYFKPPVEVQTYKNAQEQIGKFLENVTHYEEGWDDVGKVGWRAYKQKGESIWRMTFVEDTKSLSHKYDFAKVKNLGGVGIWALGYDEGKSELWEQLSEKFGTKSTSLTFLRKPH